MNRLAAFLSLALLVVFAGQTRAVAKALTGQNIASGVFAENHDSRARFDTPQSLDFAGETRACGYETASGRSKWPNRDPIGERGGLNLFAMVNNDPLKRLDVLGLATLFHPSNADPYSEIPSPPETTLNHTQITPEISPIELRGRFPHEHLPEDFSEIQCECLCSLLELERQHGTRNAALMVGGRYGGGLGGSFNSSYVPDIETPHGTLDPDWFTTLRSNTPEGMTGSMLAPHIYTCGKLLWMAIRKTGGTGPYASSGERNAVDFVVQERTYAQLLKEVMISRGCDCCTSPLW